MQMKADPKDKMNGINTWFIIEILSFYGYILSAVVLIIRNTCLSSWGYRKKVATEFGKDFLAKHKGNMDWAACIIILLTVNFGLVVIDRYIYKDISTK